MNRRRFLKISVSLAGSTTFAGCSSNKETSISDTDGDGVIDSEDYAPRDASVQQKSDVKDTAQSSAKEQNGTPETPSTNSPTATPIQHGGIQANYEPVKQYAWGYFKWYSSNKCRFVFKPRGFDNLQNRMKPVIFAQEYPSGDFIDSSGATPIEIASDKQEVTIEYSLELDSAEDHFLLGIALIPPEESLADVQESNIAYLCETDRLIYQNGTLEKAAHPNAKSSVNKEEYSRISGEGIYLIQVHGDVEFAITVYKHAYILYNQKITREPKDVVQNSYTNGVAKPFAEYLDHYARKLGYTTAREQVNYAVKVIQSFPYVKDSVDDSYDDYNKYPVETIVEGGGDCEDTSILLATGMLAEPFGYGCALIYLPYDDPDHVATGLKGGDNVSGTYYSYNGVKYYYTETTGEGWEIGELPSQYRDEEARIVPLI